MFYLDKTVSFSETAPDRMIRITEMIDYFQDVCTRQSEEAGVGLMALRKLGYGWVVSSWQIVVNRYPLLDEKVRVGTAPYQFKGVMGLRNFRMETPNGELLAYANSTWSFIDIEKMTLARIVPEVVNAYELDERMDMDYAPRKIHIPESLAVSEPIEVKYHHLDSNGHVNNGQYVSMAEDLLPEGRRAAQIRVEYRASAHLGDIIMPYVSADSVEGKHTVVLADADMNPYVITEFSGNICG